jgi:predicted metalloprotease
LQTIVSESRADYFSWYFLKHVLRSGVKDKSIITQCENFVFWLSDSISDLQIDIQKRVFYSVDWDVHGTSEHRLEMFHQGLYSGNFEYLQNITNFIPDRIEKIDSKDPKYYWETSKNSRNNLEYHEKV